MLVRSLSGQHGPDPMLPRQTRQHRLGCGVQVEDVMLGVMYRVLKVVGELLIVHLEPVTLDPQPESFAKLFHCSRGNVCRGG
ncbi:hypothetical protein ISF_09617 [Cordyceps fumosorosea ARSEF 2679]|uniref:Uncharacterized protein n=1 Tax=Cordyceps fumosorosea (strain ARSEF 2679) TaxID=1081104 RepID=A0A162LU49_CORFA|nr:hypothetical protein ISF_09617 [Cordyceps fumosorosea ARSEF 2679]OAA44730.1 hypothetical protein ISF_09617 [Cordyceps fumosorosea ARSEF 2679]